MGFLETAGHLRRGFCAGERLVRAISLSRTYCSFDLVGPGVDHGGLSGHSIRQQVSTNTSEKAVLEEITCLRDVPERIDGVAPDFAPELRTGYVLDNRFVIDKPVSRSGMATIYL